MLKTLLSDAALTAAMVCFAVVVVSVPFSTNLLAAALSLYTWSCAVYSNRTS